MDQPIIKLDLTKLSKTKTHSITFQEKFPNIQNNSPGHHHHHIYTDGFKQGMKVGCAAIFQNQELLKRRPNELSIYSEEAIVIDQAMIIIVNHKSSKFIIYPNQFSKLYRTKIHQLFSPQDYSIKRILFLKIIASFLLG